MGRRSRGPYASQREVRRIDWTAMQAESDRQRREEARVQREAAEWSKAARENPFGLTDEQLNPVPYLAERTSRLELRLDALEERLDTIIELLQGQEEA